MTAQPQSEATAVTQSRVGKKPIPLPKGVDFKLNGRHVTVKGGKGELSRELPEGIKVVVEDGEIVVEPAAGAGKRGRQFQGLTRALIASMVKGVAEGYATSLDLVGVGYRAEVKGQDVTLALGLSHQVKYKMHPSVAARVETIDEGGVKRPRLHLTSHDKEALGQTAARIRSFRKPEPYKGKGVRYTGEKLREKAGKAGGKK
ncbi:MAG TPA: 50S ribosomal protein L6 [Polyangiales bacterium]|jgi:large subunit ribosomal protein L6|nr:50S ribosomal protein L6 [Polyangiales bacterium]